MIKLVGGQLNQWDIGRSVCVTGDATHVHFANRGDSKAVIQEIVNGEAKIPDHLLRTGKVLVAYAVLNGVTLESMHFPVKKREMPEHYEYTDEMNYLYVLIANAEEATNAANQAASDILQAKQRGEFNANADDELTEMWLEMSELREQRESVQSWPVLKPGFEWRSPINGVRQIITEIRFEKQHTAVDGEHQFDPAYSGTIAGYYKDGVVSICTGGADKLRLNESSSGIFSGLPSLKTISGLEYVDTSLVTAIAGAYDGCSIEEIDISNFHLERVTNAAGMFANCKKLKKVKFSKYGISAMKSITGNDKSGANGMFQNCTELVEVDMGRGLTDIGKMMFQKCLKLETIKGLSSVTHIGERAFSYTPSLKYMDINPDLIQGIEQDACRMSNIEDIVDLSVVDLSLVAEYATRHKRWSAEALSEIRNVALPTVYMDVPNHENQDNYPDTNFCYGMKDDDTEPKYYSVADSGCSSLAIYHEWQIVHAGEYANYGEWFAWFNEQYSAQNSGADFATNNTMTGRFPNDAILETIGWSCTDNNKQQVVGASQLEAIVQRLSANKATYASVKSVNTTGYHAVLIIGADASTGKIAVIDSHVTGTTATIAWLRFEDVFSGGEKDDRIHLHEYSKEE